MDREIEDGGARDLRQVAGRDCDSGFEVEFGIVGSSGRKRDEMTREHKRNKDEKDKKGATAVVKDVFLLAPG
jgi:hypothetical protein